VSPSRLTGDILTAAAASLLLAFVVVSVAVQDRSRLRAASVQGCWFESEAVGRGQTVTRERRFRPGQVVDVVGWNPLVAAPTDAAYEAELTLYDEAAKTRVFGLVQRRTPPARAARWDPVALPDGTGYRVAAGRVLTLRFRISNTGERDFWSEMSGAQIRYLPGE
jgi:hypothetical protein